jgi:uncharacterized protein YdhG (YjbR/CyaY superfamily)
MDEPSAGPGPVDAYIARFPEATRALLEAARAAIHAAAPGVEEAISYQMAAFKLAGRPLVYLAGYGRHISLYPAPVDVAEFAQELAPYASGKGTLKLPLDKPIPLDLIRRIVQFRAQGGGESAGAGG